MVTSENKIIADVVVAKVRVESVTLLTLVPL